jgi:hypothetical protein
MVSENIKNIYMCKGIGYSWNAIKIGVKFPMHCFYIIIM